MAKLKPTLTRYFSLWSVVGAVVMALLLARWTWVLFAPTPIAVATVPVLTPATETGLLFGAAPVVVQPSAEVAPVAPVAVLPDVRLIGIFAGKRGKTGFIVMMIEGKQKALVIGDEVANGFKLSAIHADHAILDHESGPQRVELAVPNKGGSPSVNNAAQGGYPQPNQQTMPDQQQAIVGQPQPEN